MSVVVVTVVVARVVWKVHRSPGVNGRRHESICAVPLALVVLTVVSLVVRAV